MPVDQILGCFKTLVEEIQFRGQPVKLILNKFKIRDCGEKKIKVTFKRHGTLIFGTEQLFSLCSHGTDEPGRISTFF